MGEKPCNVFFWGGGMDDFDGFSMPRVFFSNDLLDATIWGTTFLIGFNNIQQLWDGLFLHPYWGKISQDFIFSTSLKPLPSKNQCRCIWDLFEQWQWSKSGARKGICRASRCRGLDFLSSVASYCNGASRCLCEKPGGGTRVKRTALVKISCQWWLFSQPQLELCELDHEDDVDASDIRNTTATTSRIDISTIIIVIILIVIIQQKQHRHTIIRLARPAVSLIPLIFWFASPVPHQVLEGVVWWTWALFCYVLVVLEQCTAETWAPIRQTSQVAWHVGNKGLTKGVSWQTGQSDQRDVLSSVLCIAPMFLDLASQSVGLSKSAKTLFVGKLIAGIGSRLESHFPRSCNLVLQKMVLHHPSIPMAIPWFVDWMIGWSDFIYLYTPTVFRDLTSPYFLVISMPGACEPSWKLLGSNPVKIQHRIWRWNLWKWDVCGGGGVWLW